MPPRNRRWSIALLAAAAVVAGACARPDRAGLQVKGYAADIVFGANQPEEPAMVTPPVDLTPAQAVADVVLPAEAPPPKPPLKVVGPPPAPRKACPDATPGSAASLPAALTVPDNVRPEAGTYRWKKSGTLTLAAAPNTPLPIGGFEQRKVRVVREVADGVYSFETVQPFLDGRSTIVTTWQVKPNAAAQRASALSAAVTVGDPERGLVIKSVDQIDPDGSHTLFAPATGLLILPLPVVPGEQFSSVAIDPKTQETRVYQASVGTRDRVDACGQFVEGWQVSGTLTISGGSAPMTYTLWAAPQYGALPILETFDATGTIESHKITYSLGQLHPDTDAGG